MNQSPLSPNAANRWVNCQGSTMLSLTHPSIESVNNDPTSKLEGRAMHEVAERILLSFKSTTNELVSREHIVGTTSKDGVLIDDEIYDAAREYVNDVLKFCNETGSLRALHVEDLIELDGILSGMYGYCDAWVFDHVNMTLVVWDAKYGHRHVEAFENWQLICYVYGILERLKVNGHSDQAINVSMRIAQPRSFHGDGPISTWDVKASDLRAHFNTLKAAAIAAFEPDGKCTVTKQCGYCPARYACDAFRDHVMSQVDYVGECNGTTLDGNALATQLRIMRRAFDQIKALKESYEEQAMSLLQRGENVVGFGTVQGKGNVKWRKDTPVDEVIMMADLMGVDARKPQQLLTPKQLEKKGIDTTVISAYTEQPSTGVKLVELTTDKIRNIFKRG